MVNMETGRRNHLYTHIYTHYKLFDLVPLNENR